jgi:predicted amidohydrolase
MNKIAVVQMTTTMDRQQNLETAFAFIDQAAAENADLVAFPENFLLLGEKEHYLAAAESIRGPLVKMFQKKAISSGISILMGSIYERIADKPNKAHNTSVLIDNKGTILATYRKVHLFDVGLKDVKLLESELIEPGKQVVAVDHEIGKVGLTICYDIRFPNLYQKLSKAGAVIIFVPAAFTVPTGKAHWINLLRTRAIENQVYIAAAAQYGKHSATRESFGSSVIIDPWGDIISILPEGEGVIFAEIDANFQTQIRSRMPVDSHKIAGIDY